jgi:precorrin-2 dehydrogenase / sirohydrochlorin ferrochelatase
MMLDVADRLAVIVGGGEVAVRKARSLLAAGATRVRVVSPEISDQMPEGVERVPELFDPRHLEGAGLVFAATNSAQVNAAIVGEARRRGVLVNRADVSDEAPGDFATPAIWKRGAVTITVSTSGSAALAVKVRDDIAKKIDPLHVKMAAAMTSLRPALRRARNLSPIRRREAIRGLASDDAMAALEVGGMRGLKNWLKERFPEL